jgi:hypothetical protein
MTIILSGECPSADIGAARIGQTQGTSCLVQLLGARTPWQQLSSSTKVCSGYTATRFLRNRFTAVTVWISPVMIRPPGIDHGAFVVSPSTVWYARVLFLFAASASTDTGSKSFECALVSTLETYDDPETGFYLHYINYSYNVYYALYSYYTCYMCTAGWLKIGWLSDSLRAWPRKACSLYHSHW